MKRRIYFRPAFDKQHLVPAKNYGIHGMELVFELTTENDEGITFTISTNWQLPHVQQEIDSKPLNNMSPYLFHKPQPFGLDGHWKTPQYEGQQPIQNCLITKGDCYCDGTAITDDLFALLVSEGEEAVWKVMEERFNIWSKK